MMRRKFEVWKIVFFDNKNKGRIGVFIYMVFIRFFLWWWQVWQFSLVFLCFLLFCFSYLYISNSFFVVNLYGVNYSLVMCVLIVFLQDIGKLIVLKISYKVNDKYKGYNGNFIIVGQVKCFQNNYLN